MKRVQVILNIVQIFDLELPDGLDLNQPAVDLINETDAEPDEILLSERIVISPF